MLACELTKKLKVISQKQEGNGPVDERRRPNLASELKPVPSMIYISMHLHISYMVPYYGLLGHHSLQTALEVKSDLGFEISDLNYLCNPSFKVHLLVRK